MSDPWDTEVSRNPSWLNSVKLTFSKVIFYAPLDIHTLIWPVLKASVIGLLHVMAVTIFWFSCTLFNIGAGLCGFISLPSNDTDTTEGLNP